MSLRALTVCIVFNAFAACAVHSQDPFDDLDANPAEVEQPRGGRAPSSSDATAVDVSERDAVVLSLRNNPPQDAIQLAKAVQYMVRIRRWDEAGKWLDRLATMELTPDSSLQIVEAIGSRSLFEIESQLQGLSDAQRGIVAKIREAAVQALHNPNTLMRRVEQLRSTVKADRLAAFDAIKAAGDAGITAMVNSVMSEQSEVPNASMVEAFSLLGDHATRAWHVAMTTPHSDARQRLVALVARAPKPTMGCELMAEMHDPELQESSKEWITRVVHAGKASLPSADEVHAYAIQQVDRSLEDYKRRRALNEVDTEIMWHLKEDGRGVVEGSAVPAMIQLARASEAAQVALRLIPESNVASATAVAAHWELWAMEGHGDPSEDAVFRSIVPETMRDSPEFACLVWDASLHHKLFGAQALAVGNLSRWEGAGIPTSVRERLVSATRSGHPAVRYQATVSLMKSLLEMNAEPTSEANKSKRGFDGSSRVDIVGREMQQLSVEPTALIVGGNSGLRSHVAGLVEQLGYRHFELASAAEVFSTLRSSLPVDAIFVVDHVRELDLGQVVQRIRANPSTSRTPIALLADSLSRGEHAIAEEDPLVVMGSVPPSVAGLGDIARRMGALADPPAISAESRILFKDSAYNYFRSTSPSAMPSAAGAREGLMAATKDEQQNLLRIVNDSTVPMTKRQQASQIFVQSVRRFGLLISSESARDQYDVYNTRGETEPVTRAVVGRILDAIEASNGQKAWSEVAP